MEATPTELVFALAAGAVLGAWFFGALLWTVRSLPASRHPALLLFASFLLRTGVVLAGLGALLTRHWLLPVVAMVGFLVTRQVFLLRGAPGERKSQQEAPFPSGHRSAP